MHSVSNAPLLSESQYLLGGRGGGAFGITCVSYLSTTFAKTEGEIRATFDRVVETAIFMQRVIITFTHIKICDKFQKKLTGNIFHYIPK
jgi:hypothetical protein